MNQFILICQFLLISFLVLITSGHKECARETDYCINGETTVNGHKCIQWSKSNYKFLKIFENTTLCQVSKNNKWCATNGYYSNIKYYDWDYCFWSQCTQHKFCENMINWQISENSINLNISNEFDILIILMEFYYECSILYNYGDTDSAENIMKTNFAGCQRLKIIEKGNLISFDNLHQNKEYKFYILPILNKKLEGSVYKLILKTKISKPSIPLGIDINSITKTSFKIAWKRSISSKTFGEAKSYRIIYNNQQTRNTSKDEIFIFNLKPCKQYCFTLAAINEAGISNETAMHCVKTKPVFHNVSNILIEYQSPSSRLIKWQYNNTFDCDVIFQVFTWNTSMNSSSKQIETKNQTVILTNLTPNQYYKIKIISKVGNETGNPSISSEFHTMLVPSFPSFINIINVETNSLQLNWTKSVQTNLFGHAEGYEININSTNKAMFNVTQTNISIANLIPCRTYCLNIFAFNIAGKSQPSNNLCFSTKLGSFDEVTIEKIKMNSRLPRFQWKYINKLNCSNLSFKVEWYTERNFQIFSSQTNKNFILLDKLNYNQKYFIKVRPEFNEEYGKYSEQHEIIIENKNSSSKNYFIYIFISLLLISFVSFGYFNKNYLFMKFKNIRNHKAMPISESKAVKSNICTSILTSNDEQIRKQTISKIKSEKCQQKIGNENEISLTNKFKQLGVKAKAYENLKNLTTNMGELSENKCKNRFVNILPFDQSRVILKKEFLGSDYINANYIPFINNVKKYEYIASQGPINETISHFWQMIWENNVSIIVMLTRTYEEDKFKCLQYWPNNNIQQEEFGKNKEFIVSILEEKQKGAVVERKLKIQNKEENEERSLIHLHMVEWFDYSAPKLEDFEQLVFRFQEIVLQKDYHPYLIHCSAGVGRTGTFIVLDRIIRELMKGSKNIDISNEILELRKYRKFMVQRAAQLIFIHEFHEYFVNKYICLSDIDEENLYFNAT